MFLDRANITFSQVKLNVYPNKIDAIDQQRAFPFY